MNIEQANSIPLAQILHIVTAAQGKPTGAEIAYLSPFRKEKTASFFVNPRKNVWYDHGEGIGGDVVTLVCYHLKAGGESHTVSDALRWLSNMTGNKPRIAPVKDKGAAQAKDKSLSLSKVVPLQHTALLDYLKARSIPKRLANIYLGEVWLYNKETKKNSFAIGFENESGGYELRNPFLKITLKKKDITFIRGREPKPDGIHLFEGVMDFLSALSHYQIDRFKEDAIVFNSLSLMNEATPLIQGYGYKHVHTWMDNDIAGRKANDTLSQFFASEPGLKHTAMNHLYVPHKDVNAWHMSRLGLMPL